MLAKNPSYITEDVLEKVTLRAADFWARCAPFLKNPIQPLTISKKCFFFHNRYKGVYNTSFNASDEIKQTTAIGRRKKLRLNM
jgi:hypothetical protein